jgi:hypothetical protein
MVRTVIVCGSSKNPQEINRTTLDKTQEARHTKIYSASQNTRNSLLFADDNARREDRKVGKQERRKEARMQIRMQDARDSREEATALARTSERSSPALAATPIETELGRASVSPRTRAVHSLCAETKIRLNRSTKRSTGRGIQVEMQAERRGRRETCTR